MGSLYVALGINFTLSLPKGYLIYLIHLTIFTPSEVIPQSEASNVIKSNPS